MLISGVTKMGPRGEQIRVERKAPLSFPFYIYYLGFQFSKVGFFIFLFNFQTVIGDSHGFFLHSNKLITMKRVSGYNVATVPLFKYHNPLLLPFFPQTKSVFRCHKYCIYMINQIFIFTSTNTNPSTQT